MGIEQDLDKMAYLCKDNRRNDARKGTAKNSIL